MQSLIDLVSPVIHPLATTGLIVIFVVFILLQREDLRNRMIRLAGSHDIQRTTAAIDDAAHRLSRLYLVQLGLNTAFAVVISLGLWIIGIPSPILWGILAGVMRFVPYVGAFLSALFPLTLAIAVDPGWTMLLWTAALFVIVEPLVGHVVEPLLFGKTTGLSPIAVVISAAFWTWLWGPIGLLLATPLTVCLVVLGRHVEKLEFLDVMFGSTPALSPQEVFYQRMLASDPLEAADQAEEFLAENRLAAYYDEVALPGLKMAQADVSRGVLVDTRVESLRDAAVELVSDLSDIVPNLRASKAENGEANNGQPIEPTPATPKQDLAPEWQGDHPVLCVPGRSPLDEAAAQMLAHVLTRVGLPSRIEAAGALTTARLFRLDPAGVAMVCLSYLDTSSPGHMRYAVKRLRRKFPGSLVMVGAWHMDVDERINTIKQTVAADFFVTTVTEAAQVALSAAKAKPAEAKLEARPGDSRPGRTNASGRQFEGQGAGLKVVACVLAGAGDSRPGDHSMRPPGRSRRCSRIDCSRQPPSPEPCHDQSSPRVARNPPPHHPGAHGGRNGHARPGSSSQRGGRARIVCRCRAHAGGDAGGGGRGPAAHLRTVQREPVRAAPCGA